MKKLIILIILLFCISCIPLPAQVYTIQTTSKETCLYDTIKEDWGDWAKTEKITTSITLDIDHLLIIIGDQSKETFKLAGYIEEEKDEKGTWMSAVFTSIDKEGKKPVIFIQVFDSGVCIIGAIYLFDKIYRYYGVIVKQPPLIIV